MSIKFKYEVSFLGEYSAGFHAYSDFITIEVESGDPGGDKEGQDSFAEYMKVALSEWFDGANIRIKKF